METLFSKMYKKSRELFTHGEIRNILTKESNTALCFLGKKKRKIALQSILSQSCHAYTNNKKHI